MEKKLKLYITNTELQSKMSFLFDCKEGAKRECCKPERQGSIAAPINFTNPNFMTMIDKFKEVPLAPDLEGLLTHSKILKRNASLANFLARLSSFTQTPFISRNSSLQYAVMPVNCSDGLFFSEAGAK